jgi:hypothetical protein
MPHWSSYDLVCKIRSSLGDSPIKWKWVHIKGHQDHLAPFDNLNYFAKNNVIVDLLASYAHHIQSKPCPHIIRDWIPSINGKFISGTWGSTLKWNIYKPLMTKWWTSIFQVSDDDAEHCDWDAFYWSILTWPTTMQIQFTKYNSRLLPVGTNLVLRKHSMTCAPAIVYWRTTIM